MTTEQIKAALRATPFQPFTIRMVDGRSFPVEHRDFVSMSPSGRTISVFYGRDEHSILDMLLMSEIEMNSSAEGAA